VYTPARSDRTGAPAAVRNVIVSLGPTVATSLGVAAVPGSASARAAIAVAAAAEPRGRIVRVI
jgi:hypothetical protein